MSDKQAVLEVLRRMPEDASLDQIQEELAILAAIRRGEAAVSSGQVLTHEEVKQRSASWISK